ncbi:hypothetical protein D7U98_09625 [Stenotrophomonas maltophilia]|uniref:hypothetical protein n=1 Tax=Stenotrophomonas maltophilia TaxID=40324 RepID=UPI00131039CE|nr:hypothetical protein [Stenotrophomonas maltophilia]ELF4099103.1 hypothetical protein [Stenotrophomonas maltophilia]MBA0395657.1 hypothetical protein [Stenotrophomonas maltophilia]WQI19794.1 hypothetical protein U2S91_16825 [Stenotrophomonas maltophilia]
MLQLEKHDAEFSHLNLRKEKHGESSVPAATITFQAGSSSLILDSIDNKLRPSFYEEPSSGSQQNLPIDGNYLTALKFPYLKEQKIGMKIKGYELEIHSLLEHIDPIFFADAELVIEKVFFIEGGSVQLILKVNTTIESEDFAPLLEAWDRGAVSISLTPPSAAAQQADLAA